MARTIESIFWLVVIGCFIVFFGLVEFVLWLWAVIFISQIIGAGMYVLFLEAE